MGEQIAATRQDRLSVPSIDCDVAEVYTLDQIDIAIFCLEALPQRVRPLSTAVRRLPEKAFCRVMDTTTTPTLRNAGLWLIRITPDTCALKISASAG